MTTRVLTEDQILESYMQIAALEREIVKRDHEIAERKHEIARLCAQQANNSQESQKTETESPNTKSQDRKDNQTAIKVNLEPEDTEDQAEIAQLQSQNQNQDDITSTDLTLRPCAKGKLYDIGPYVGTAGESRVSHESCDAPSPSRFQSTIVEGGVEGDPVTREIEQGIDIRQSTGRLDDDDHRGAITIKSALKTEGLASPEEPFKEERQVRIADDLDSGQGPPSSRKEPAMFAAEHPFTVDDYNASDSNDYDFNYHFKISDMGTIMKDKGLRLALGG